MKFVIDTSSLLSFARYYHAHDDKNVLVDYFESLFVSESEDSLILLESVSKETKGVARKIVTKTLPFLKEERFKKKIYKNLDVETDKLHRKIDRLWFNNKSVKVKNYSETKRKAIIGADFQLILYALKYKKEGVVVVTEESAHSNDGKTFKKIPMICKHEQIPCITLPEMLKRCELQVTYSIKK